MLLKLIFKQNFIKKWHYLKNFSFSNKKKLEK